MMRKFYIFGLIALAGIIIGLAWAEQLTLTTYYPAPYGAYKTMKADILHVERTQQAEHDSVTKEEGMIICDDGDNTLKRWDSSAGDWVPLCAPVVAGGLQVVGKTDIFSPGNEALMDGMKTTVTTSASKLLVKFCAPIAKNPAYSGTANADIRLYVDGIVEAGTSVSTDKDYSTRVHQVNFYNFGWTAGPDSHTVEVKWQGSGMMQPGATCAERVLTVIPF